MAAAFRAGASAAAAAVVGDNNADYFNGQGMTKRKIGIIGLGLIGGSLALALNDAYDVIGYDKDERTREAARRLNIDVSERCEMGDARIIFSCVPVFAMKTTLDMLTGKYPNAVVTDVASVKSPFAATGGRYVGGHPMAGTEKDGITAARPHLFENAYWVITGKGRDAELVADTVGAIGAKPVFMSAEEHDRSVAAFSHAPHAVAYALVASAVKDGASPIAGSGFIDTTRIAKSDGGFWSEIFALNRDNVLGALAEFRAELDAVSGMIERGETDKLKAYLDRARIKRAALDRSDLGGAELYVDLVDRVGEFERVTGVIARAGINLANIALVPAREGAGGALRLEFVSEADRERAAAALGSDEDGEIDRRRNG